MRTEAPQSKELTPPFTTVVAIDTGSTSIKIETWMFDGQTFKLMADQRPWIDYEPKVINLKNQDQIKILNSEQLEEIFDKIKNQLLTSKERIDDSLLMTAITGFNHSLVLNYHGKNIVILDDPTPTAIASPEQLDILKQYLNPAEIDLLPKKPSTLGKLIYIINHPEVIKELFGPDASLADLTFSTMRGLIAQSVSNRKQASIPKAELRSFGKWEEDLDQLYELLAALGVNKNQISFEKSNFSASTEGHTFDNGDFGVEQQICEFMAQKPGFDPETLFISLDTVGKISADYPQMPKKLEIGYDTQRMTARINKDWMKPLAVECQEMVDVYPFVDEILEEAITTNLETPYIFYPVENGLGVLLKRDDQNLQEVSLAQACQKDLEERKKIILALGLGVAFSLRQKVETIRQVNNISQDKPIYLYGGLVGKNKKGPQVGWRKLFVEALPETNIQLMGLPSGASAVAFNALNSLGWSNSWTENFNIETQSLGEGNKKFLEYLGWLEIQENLITHNKLNSDEWKRLRAS